MFRTMNLANPHSPLTTHHSQFKLMRIGRIKNRHQPDMGIVFFIFNVKAEQLIGIAGKFGAQLQVFFFIDNARLKIRI